MKRIFTTIALFGLLAVGCTKTENLPDTPDLPNADVEDTDTPSYLSFGLVTPGSGGSRGSYKDDEYKGDYEDGSNYENSVKDIRFYFFDDKGDPVGVKRNPAKNTGTKDGYDSFYDYNENFDDRNDTTTPDQTNTTIEKTITVTMTLSLDNKKVPTRVIAILNPSEDFRKDTNNYKISDLGTITDDYLPKDLTTSAEGQMVISNSVYYDEEIMNYTEITLTDEGQLYQSIEKAQENKTTIFVERTVARVDLSTTLTAVGSGYTPTDKSNVYDTGKKYKKYNETTESNIDRKSVV